MEVKTARVAFQSNLKAAICKIDLALLGRFKEINNNNSNNAPHPSATAQQLLSVVLLQSQLPVENKRKVTGMSTCPASPIAEQPLSVLLLPGHKDHKHLKLSPKPDVHFMGHVSFFPPTTIIIIIIIFPQSLRTQQRTHAVRDNINSVVYLRRLN